MATKTNKIAIADNTTERLGRTTFGDVVLVKNLGPGDLSVGENDTIGADGYILSTGEELNLRFWEGEFFGHAVLLSGACDVRTIDGVDN